MLDKPEDFVTEPGCYPQAVEEGGRVIMSEVHIEDYQQGRLLKSQTITDEYGTFEVKPGPDEGTVRVKMGEGAKLRHYALSAEEAYWFGDALMNHAKECGFDPSVED